MSILGFFPSFFLQQFKDEHVLPSTSWWWWCWWCKYNVAFYSTSGFIVIISTFSSRYNEVCLVCLNFEIARKFNFFEIGVLLEPSISLLYQRLNFTSGIFFFFFVQLVGIKTITHVSHVIHFAYRAKTWYLCKNGWSRASFFFLIVLFDMLVSQADFTQKSSFVV